MTSAFGTADATVIAVDDDCRPVAGATQRVPRLKAEVEAGFGRRLDSAAISRPSGAESVTAPAIADASGAKRGDGR